ncbi:MAG: GTPase HflX, partial [Clostridia bacterium]|nr:GTPase HflX [Clostridia bacterium]
TVGFISNLPHHLIEAFHSTLEEVREADLLLHVVDGSSADWDRQMDVCHRLLEQLGAAQLPLLTVVNKADLLPRSALPHLAGSVAISALTGEGVPALLTAMEDKLAERRRVAELMLPYPKAGLLPLLYQRATVLSADYEEEGIRVRLQGDAATLGRAMEALKERR